MYGEAHLAGEIPPDSESHLQGAICRIFCRICRYLLLLFDLLQLPLVFKTQPEAWEQEAVLIYFRNQQPSVQSWLKSGTCTWV